MKFLKAFLIRILTFIVMIILSLFMLFEILVVHVLGMVNYLLTGRELVLFPITEGLTGFLSEKVKILEI